MSLFAIVDGEVTTDRLCTRCPLGLKPGLQSNCMKGVGVEKPLLLFVGISPGPEDDEKGIPYTGPTGRLFHDLLFEAGIRKDEFYVTNAVKCASDDPQRKHWDKCQEHLVRELERLQPAAVITVGSAAARWLTGSAPNRKRSYKLLLDPSIRCYTIKQPAELYHVQGQRRAELREQMLEDLRWIRKDVDSPQQPREVDYQLAASLDDVDRYLAELQAAQHVAYDFETNFLGRPYREEGHRIEAVGFSMAPGHGRAIPIHAKAIKTPTYWPDGVAAQVETRVANFLRQKEVFGHSGILYDSMVSEVLLGVKPKISFDTMHCAHLIDENPPHGLEYLALKYTDLDGWKTKFNTEDPKKLAEYLCQDVDATFRLREALEPQLSNKQRRLYDTLVIPLAWTLRNMMMRGVHVDKSVLESFNGPMRARIAELDAHLREFDEVIAWELSKNKFFNPGSPVQVADLLENVFKFPRKKETKSGGYSTDDEVLEKLLPHPFVSTLLERRSLDKLAGSYVANLIEAIHPSTALAHTSFKMLTVTGRLSSEGPNLQVLPTEADEGVKADFIIKDAFKARAEGWCLLQGDLSQAEYRVLASLSGDKALIEGFAAGLDVHLATAMRIYGIKDPKEVTKQQRTNAKRVNFGLVYGQSEQGQVARAIAAAESQARKEKRKLSRKDLLAVETSVRNAIALHQKTYVGVWAWMAKQERVIEAHAMQETPTGRRRHYAKVDNRAKRQGLNFPVQGLSADITNTALVRCERVLEESGLDCFAVLTVHDSILFEVREDLVFDAAEVVKDVMEGVKFPWMLVPMKADLEAGYCWGKMHKLDVAKREFAK